MKKFVILGLVLFFIVGAAFAQAQRFRNGNQDATAPSYNPATSDATGSLTVRVNFRNNRMQSITVRSYTDSSAFMSMVSAQMIPAMLHAQSADVDNVAGATITANGLRQAVASAIAAARR